MSHAWRRRADGYHDAAGRRRACQRTGRFADASPPCDCSVTCGGWFARESGARKRPPPVHVHQLLRDRSGSCASAIAGTRRRRRGRHRDDASHPERPVPAKAGTGLLSAFHNGTAARLARHLATTQGSHTGRTVPVSECAQVEPHIMRISASCECIPGYRVSATGSHS
jgi:hypothetical protein